MTPPPYSPVGETRDRVYRFVRERLLAGQPPSLREIQAALGFKAVESVRQHLDKLVAAGRLLKLPGRARGFVLPESELAAVTVDIPLLGRIPAGGLQEAVEEREGSIPVEAQRLGSQGADGMFALRVVGESMREAGILPGDVVVVRSLGDGGAGARSGDVVVALVGDEATVKTLRRSGSTIELWPENPGFEPIRRPAAEVQILGVVREVRRFLRPQSRRRAAPWHEAAIH